MNCLNCNNQLVYRETNDFIIDENGAFDRLNHQLSFNTAVVCPECDAGHTFSIVEDDGERGTIELAMNTDPLPLATLGIGIKLEEIDHIESPSLLEILVLDETNMEVARFNTHHRGTEWWERANDMAKRIPKGEWKVNYDEAG